MVQNVVPGAGQFLAGRKAASRMHSDSLWIIVYSTVELSEKEKKERNKMTVSPISLSLCSLECLSQSIYVPFALLEFWYLDFVLLKISSFFSKTEHQSLFFLLLLCLFMQCSCPLYLTPLMLSAWLRSNRPGVIPVKNLELKKSSLKKMTQIKRGKKLKR